MQLKPVLLVTAGYSFLISALSVPVIRPLGYKPS